MITIKIRSATNHDLHECFLVESACYTSEGATKEKIQRRIQTFPEGFLVAETGGRIVGIINSAATNKEDITDEEFKDMVGHDRKGKNLVIFSLAILPEFQGKGISKHLMSRFIELAKAMNKEKILLLCKSELLPYYKKYGFLYRGLSKSNHGGFKWHEMELPLSVD